MARATWVKSSRKDHICGATGHLIPAPEGYYRASPGYRGAVVFRCSQHPFRPSDLTTSARSEPMAAVEAFEDATASIESIEDLQAAWDDLGSALEDYVDMRQEGLDQWENGNSQLEELLDQAQAAYDEWEGFTPEEFTSEEFDEEPDEEKHPKRWTRWNEEREAHLAEQIEQATEVAGSLDL